jgi:hypothetical protein
MDLSTPEITAVSNPKRKPPREATTAALNADFDLAISIDLSIKVTRNPTIGN